MMLSFPTYVGNSDFPSSRLPLINEIRDIELFRPDQDVDDVELSGAVKNYRLILEEVALHTLWPNFSVECII